ncbi:MAG: EAL domain-containing protein [Gammaproteobacteria bacterium]|nr:EAL domain-containing protein [Gammaproteobacteria bacterium]
MSTIALVALGVQALTNATEGDPEPPSRFIVFGGSANYAPFEWLEDETPRGFNIELEAAIAEQGRAEARHRLLEWQDAMRQLEQGKIDVLPMFASDSRAERFLFTEPFYYLTHGIFIHRGKRIFAKPEDLAGEKIAVVDAGYAEDQFRRSGIVADILEVETIESALEHVANGEVTAAILARHPARRIATDRELPVVQVSRPFWPRRYVFAVRKDNEPMHAWLQHNLGMVQAQGRYHDIYEAWESQLEWSRPTLGETLRRYAWLIAALGTSFILVLAWSWALRRQVQQRTGELRKELERRRDAEEEIRYRAYHDPLTDLPNRSQFVLDLGILADRYQDQTLSVIVISLQGVEDVVVSFGYSVGEEMVKSFAARLEEFGFDACSHLGSGVFAAARRGDLESDSTIAAITDPLQLQDMEIDPRLRIGMATAPALSLKPGEFLRRARTALSTALEYGRPWQEYNDKIEPDPHTITLLRDYWKYGIRDFEAWFQPQFILEGEQLFGAEALVRWNHPELGMLSPGIFIPLLEKSGLIFRMTEWMIDTALEASAEWRKACLPAGVSVNVAANDLLEHDLYAVVSEALERHDVDPAMLTLEMTESGLVTEPARVSSVMRQIGDLGVRFAIDDFGTGYSSLSYLSDFPVQAIKLDRMFVTNMLEQPRHLSIVESTISLAHQLGLSVVAEGPEDQATVTLLRELGCEMAQGYALARPMPKADYFEFSRTYKISR